MRNWRRLHGVLVLALLGAILIGASGCGYVKNLRDDTMDCFILGAGVVPPVVPTGDGDTEAVGFLPPSIGLYVQATDFMHLGGLWKISGDVEMDRRGLQTCVDQRAKVGLGPLHYIQRKQTPLSANAYKVEGNQMDGWREHMRELKDPIFNERAKKLIYRSTYAQLFLHRGWQDWEMFSVEVAIPEPFILHSGLNLRLGFDPSQVFDLVLGIFTIDLYDDNAFELNGDLQHPVGMAEEEMEDEEEAM